MKYVECNLSNCFGIEKLNYKFDFSRSNTIAIYARNGIMKTSFAKTFQKIQQSKVQEVRDEIFGLEGNVQVSTERGDLEPQSVFVIKSFENSYESNSITTLLVNDTIKRQIADVLKLQNEFLKAIEKDSGLKISKTSLGRTIYELEPTLISDLKLSDEGFLLNLTRIADYINDIELDCGHINYLAIFDNSVIKKIESTEFQNSIDAFCKVSDKIYESYNFLDKGNFTLGKLKAVAKVLNANHFFVKENTVTLANDSVIKNIEELNDKIKEVDAEIKEVPEYKAIEKLFNDSKGLLLRDIIENNPEIIPYLKNDYLDKLKYQLWISYINKHSKMFSVLIDKFNKLETQLSNIDFDNNKWAKALRIFEERFTVPYKMTIENPKAAVIGASVPRVQFSFEKEDDRVSLSRQELDNINVLSQGEKRALYLLNIIFDIEKLKEGKNEVLFIIDDIADSFDYKNKYAIIEYLYEIAEIEKFRLLIFSHNFDFYHTVVSRLDLWENARLYVDYNNGEIIFRNERYQRKNPFVKWKENLNYTNILALIPFVRNIIEYTSQSYSSNRDFLLLTNLLHEKDSTKNITFDEVKSIYCNYIGVADFNEDIDLSCKVVDILYKEADMISSENCELEHKLILAMAIRHRAEEYMIKKIEKGNELVKWIKGKRIKEGRFDEFKTDLNCSKNQTRVLYGAVKFFLDKGTIKILDEVNIMTPENIHLNSFMYEPLLDMDINELLGLYQKIKELT